MNLNWLAGACLIQVVLLGVLVEYAGAEDDTCEVKIEETVASEDCGCGGSKLSRDAVWSNGKAQEEGKERINVATENSKARRLEDSSGAEMVFIPGGEFMMGTDNPVIVTDLEGPSRPVRLSSYWMDKYEVSNDQYAVFVDETGYLTDSEKFGWSFVFDKLLTQEQQDAIPQAVAGAEWWLPVEGSDWRHPAGPWEDVRDPAAGLGNHPVVQVSWTDSDTFCRWRGGRLPTEAEWEYAARGGSQDWEAMYPWGRELMPEGRHRTNIWQGKFPHENTADDGHRFLSPVDALGEQNAYGLYNMVGNAWEWVSDWWAHQLHPTTLQINPTGPKHGLEKLKKGGSFLCHESYCFRYRIAARTPSTPDSATYNNGFRCVRDVTEEENSAATSS